MVKSAFFLLSVMALATGCSSTKTESKESSTTVTDSTSTISATDSTSTQTAGDSTTSDSTKRDSIK